MFGNLLLTLALAAGIFSAIMYAYSVRGYSNTLKFGRLGFYLMSITVISASLLLLNAILTHQYQYEYVYNYSGSDLSTGLLMSTFYAGQEGSFLMWVLFTVITGLVLLQVISKKEGYEAPVMLVFTMATAFLLVMVNPLLKSPFNYIWSEPAFVDIKNINQSLLNLPFLQSFIFSDNSEKTFVKVSSELVGMLKGNNISISQFIVQGKGLNPLLQNFWMQIHPPILFVGFALSTVPYAFAIAALIKNEYKNWISFSLPWSHIGIMVLGTGIMLGGYWAYGILGWGGYWAWDPVENASFVPWIIWVAAVHTMIVQRKRDCEGKPVFVKLNIALSILVYVFVIYSTFLTRSGVLQEASVHSFVAPGQLVFLFLVIFILAIFLVPLWAMFYRRKTLKGFNTPVENFYSRELVLFSGTVILLASAAIIAAGTSAPLVGGVIDISFYNDMNLPIAILIGLVNGFSIYFRWKNYSAKEMIKASTASLIISLVLSITTITVGGIQSIMYMLLVFASYFAVVVNLEWTYKMMFKEKLNLGGYISHMGIGVFFIGVVATGGFTQIKQFELPLNETVEIFGNSVKYTGHNLIPGTNKYEFKIDVDDDGSVSTLAPVMFFSDFNKGLMREPDIREGFTSDFYITPLSFEAAADKQQGSTFNVSKGEIINYKGIDILFESFNFPQDAFSAMQEGREFFIGANLIAKKDGIEIKSEPRMKSRAGEKTYDTVTVEDFGIQLVLTWLDASGKIGLSISDINEMGPSPDAKDTLAIEVSIKPFISLVWLGTFFMMFGFVLASIRRQIEISKSN